MDPNATLAQMLQLAQALLDGKFGTDETLEDASDELAQCVLNLNEWLRKGGTLPKAWTFMNPA